MERCKNRVTLCGTLLSEPAYSHSLYAEAFYCCRIAAPRLSGAQDVLPVTVSERLFGEKFPKAGDMVLVSGQLRSYNRQENGVNRLILTVFAQSFSAGETVRNEILLCGYVCKPPIYRVTPFSREIADVLLAVNRAYGKSDYIPCICWGRNARFAGTLPVGECVCMSGRIQSREYQKRLEDGSVQLRTAYEVSAGAVETVKNE